MFFGKRKNSTENSSSPATTPVSTPAPETSSGHGISLKKASADLDKTIISLKKKGTNLEGHRARVFVVIDISGSMSHRFPNEVQEALTRIFPLALRFDDNGEMEVYVFDTRCHKLDEPMTMDNYETYVRKYITSKYDICGGTRYAPVIEDTINDYDDGSKDPAFGIIITDGDPQDRETTNKMIRRSAEYRLFYKFVGIGYERFSYLEELDDLTGRPVDNTAFIKVSEISNWDNEQLYTNLLDQYPDWLKAMHLI